MFQLLLCHCTQCLCWPTAFTTSLPNGGSISRQHPPPPRCFDNSNHICRIDMSGCHRAASLSTGLSQRGSWRRVSPSYVSAPNDVTSVVVEFPYCSNGQNVAVGKFWTPCRRWSVSDERRWRYWFDPIGATTYHHALPEAVTVDSAMDALDSSLQCVAVSQSTCYRGAACS